MSTVKISALPKISTFAGANTGNILFLGVDLSTNVTGQINGTALANNLYLNNNLVVGNNVISLPNTIAQFSGVVNSYMQINAQNFNPYGTTDLILTADDGSDAVGYVDFGINNSQWNPVTNQQTAQYPHDGYMIVQGTTNNNGNLIVGTASANANLVFAVGGYLANNVVGLVSNTGIVMNRTINFNGQVIINPNNVQHPYGLPISPALNIAQTANTIVPIFNLNSNNGIQASSDFFVLNDQYYTQYIFGDFGINSSTYVGTGAGIPFNDQNGTYVVGSGGTLTLGTKFANDLKFATNTTYRMTVNGTSGLVTFNNGISFADGSVLSSANTINTAASFANGAFTTANSAYAAQNTTASFANGAFTTANSAASFANGAFLEANSAASFANGAFTTANNGATLQSGINTTQNSWIQSAWATANGAFLEANSASAWANAINATQNTNITAAYNQANLANSIANTAVQNTATIVLNNLTLAGNLIPATSNFYNLGSPTVKWGNLYIGPNSIYMTDTVTGNTGNLVLQNGILNINGVTALGAGNTTIYANGTIVSANVVVTGSLQSNTATSYFSNSIATKTLSDSFVYGSNATVTGIQTGSRTSLVYANGSSGVIVAYNASAFTHGTAYVFTVNNSSILHASDIVIATVQSTNCPILQVTTANTRVGSFDILVTNGAGPGNDAAYTMNLNFGIIRVGS
jgi:hypothetical protein